MVNETDILRLQLVTGEYLNLQVTDRYTPEGVQTTNKFQFVVWKDGCTKHEYVRSLSITRHAVWCGSLWHHEIMVNPAQESKLCRWLFAGFAMNMGDEWHAGDFR